MPISINGTGTITGISAGGLPDASVTADELASSAVTTAKVNDGAITYGKLSASATEADNVAKRTAKAWVNFNGTGTVAIRGTPFNVSSITDNGVGNYTVNFTSAMPDTNYCFNGTAEHDSGTELSLLVIDGDVGQSTGSIRMNNLSMNTNSLVDTRFACVTIFSS